MIMNIHFGLLGEKIKVYFMHYKSFEEAKNKWYERVERINYNNLFFMMTDRDNCTEEEIRKFQNLPYNNKVLFTSKKYTKYPCTIFCEEYKDKSCVGILSDYRNITGERIYERYFDYVSWLKGEEK